ncbi:hypothetical protein F4777DRAFT_576048 [Nemania sp. FL0916]|nr:hypothetical protein F4777DRAFT_576048 [Nemania sp. FL0916]
MYMPKVLITIAALAGPSLSQDLNSAYCASKMSSFFSWAAAEGPTTPAAVLSFLATQTNSRPPLSTFGPSLHGDEICSIYSELPPSLLGEFKTYITSVLSFGNANSDVLLGVATACVPADKLASVTSYVHQMLTPTGHPCEPASATITTPAPGKAANGTYPTASVTATSSAYTVSGSANSTTYTTPTSSPVFTAAAARPTGAFLGAAALGGVLGAAAML